jgi:hypothetical protein
MENIRREKINKTKEENRLQEEMRKIEKVTKKR